MNYTLYLSTLSIPNPSSAIVLGSVLQYQLQNLSEGTYHWYVAASNGALSSESTIQSFQVCNPIGPGSATGLSPASGTIVNPRNVNFQWVDGSQGKSCTLTRRGLPVASVLYSADSSLASPQSSGSLSKSSWSPFNDSSLVLSDGIYYWAVESQLVTSRGTLSALSQINMINLCTQRAPTAPTLASLPSVVDARYPVSLQWSMSDVGKYRPVKIVKF